MEKRLSLLLVSLFLCIGAAFGQSKISGTVVAQEDDQPIVGVSVVVEGTKTATATDLDGKFTISVPSGKKLVFSYLGMKKQVLEPKNGMRVVMESDLTNLQEVVVTGMTQQDKRLFSGAATKISAEDAKLDGMADISRSLEGRAAGVSVQNVSGTFGTAPKIRVRGATSIYGSSKPLWVVDGVIMDDVADVSAESLSSGDASTLISSAIAGLNSDDIESFQILKDGSATSIYGARAMAGVIVVTTKKGRAGQSHIGYTTELTYRLKPSYRNFNIMNSQEQMAVYQEMQQKGWLNYAETANASNSGIYGKMYQMLSQYDPITKQFALANTEEAKLDYLRAAEYRNTNWFDLLFNNSIMHNHSVSLSGGTDKSQYYGSLSAMFDPGWTLMSKVERYTANMNFTQNINRLFTLNLIGNASYRKQKAPGTLSSSVDPVSGAVGREFDINPYSYALNTSRTLDPNAYYTRSYAPFNIFNELNNNNMDLGVSDFRVSGSLDFKPIQKLKLTFLAAVKNTSTVMEHYIKDQSNQALSYRAMSTTAIRDANPYLYKNPDDTYPVPVSILPNGGIYERTDRSIFGYDTRISATYSDVFNQKHTLNLYGGMETNYIERHGTWFRGWGMQYDKGEIASYNYLAFKRGQEDAADYYSMLNQHYRSAAFFGTATYSYDYRYQLTGTARYEGTNYLGKATSARWLPTWNISGMWNIYNEKWFNPVFQRKLSHATLRMSYSLTGDRPAVTNALPIFNSYNPWRPFTNVNETGISMALGNKSLTYEKKHEFNIGTDLGFLENRINVTFDAYWRNNYDLIGYANTQLSGDATLANVAAMKSHGMEMSISTQNIKKKDFSWNTDFIFSYARNEITELYSPARIISLVQGTGFPLVGYPVRSLFSIPFMGLNKEGLPTFRDQNGNITTTGIDFQERDPSKTAFLKYEGSIDPIVTGSLGNVFNYKNFTLNLFVTYSFGNVIRLDDVFSSNYSDLTAMTKEFKNRFVVAGDEDITSIPVLASRRQYYNDPNIRVAYNSYNYSDARVAKGDFIRMKEISLGYEFPKSMIGRLGVSALSLKLQATNLFLLYADKKLNGQDPEFFNTGGVAVPTPKQFTLTLRVGL